MTAAAPAVRAGADAFIKPVTAMSKQGTADFEALGGRETDVVPYDYVRLCGMIEEGIALNVSEASVMHRQGFLRALATLVMVNLDGAGLDMIEGWDSLAESEASFARARAHG